MVNSLSRTFQEKNKLFDFKLTAYPKKIKNSLNIILFVIVFLSLPKSSFGSCSSGYIELTVNQDGLTQIINTYYSAYFLQNIAIMVEVFLH